MHKIENFKNTFQTSNHFFPLTIYTLSLIKYKPALLTASLIAIDPSRDLCLSQAGTKISSVIL
jgi:hypothetical protein